MGRKVAFALAGAFAAVAAPNGASAQQLKDEILVEGRYLSLDKLNAVKTPTPLVDIPQSLSIVGEAQIAEQAFTNLGDVLRYTPGLSISQGEGHRDAIVIRGNQTTADFFIDGLRDDVQYFRPFYNVEQIEVLRGSNALLFGRGGGGGVINRVMKRPVQGARTAGYQAGADTFGSYTASGDVNAALSDAAAVRLNGFYEELANHRDAFDGRRYALNPTFALDLGERTSVLASYEYVNDERVVDRGVPSVANPNGPDRPLTGFDNTFFGSPDDNLTTFEAHILRARVDHTFSEALRGNVTAQYADYDKLYQNLFPVGFDAAGVTLDGYRDTTERQNLIVQANLVSEFETGPFGHTLLFGAEYGDQDTANARDDTVFAATLDDRITIDFTDPLVIPAFAFSDRARDRRSDVAFASVYLQDQIDLTDALKLVAGFRYDRFDIDVLDLIEVDDGPLDGNDGRLGRVDGEISPRFGLIYKPAETMSVYASYSESFLPRSGDQFLTLSLTTQALDPQVFENIEIGAKWDVTEALSLTGALFRLERDSVTTVDPLDPGNALILDGTLTRGIELQAVGALTDRWTVNAGFSYLNGEVRGGDDDGNRTRQTPKTMFSAWSRYQASDRLAFGLGLAHQGAMFATEDNTVESPAFTRVDAAVFYDLSEAVRIQVNLENLLNTDYFPDAHSNDNISTGEPINARFTLSGRF